MGKEEKDFQKYYSMYELGREYECEGKTNEALEIYLNILKKYNPIGTAYYERPAILLEKKKRFKEAIDICLRAIKAIQSKSFNASKEEFECRLNRLIKKSDINK